MSTMSVWFAVSECPESSQASRSVEGPAETLQILSALGLIWVDSIAWDCLRLLQTAWGDWSVRYTRYSAYIQITSLQMHRQNSEYNTESARFFSVQLFQFGERIHVPLLSLLRITYDLRAFRAMRPNNRISPDTERYWEILRDTEDANWSCYILGGGRGHCSFATQTLDSDNKNMEEHAKWTIGMLSYLAVRYCQHLMSTIEPGVVGSVLLTCWSI